MPSITEHKNGDPPWPQATPLQGAGLCETAVAKPLLFHQNVKNEDPLRHPDSSGRVKNAIYILGMYDFPFR